jgi:hypothetical protein
MTKRVFLKHIVFEVQSEPGNPAVWVVARCECCGQEVSRRALDLRETMNDTRMAAYEDGLVAFDHLERCPAKAAPGTLQ